MKATSAYARRYPRSFAAVATLLALACTSSQQRPAVDAAMQDPELRHEALEATLRVTDEHPEYVDELFALTLKHPRTLDRFLQNTARGLAEDRLSRMAARRLAEEPKGLQQVMIANLDAISDKPESLLAVSQAMEARPQVAAMAVVQRDEAVRAMVKALVQEAGKNEKARRAFLAAVRENSAGMASLVAESPETISALVGAFAEVGIDKGQSELDALAKALEPGR